MNVHRVRSRKLTGTSYDELIKKARRQFHEIEGKSRRRAYIRSAYFKKEKVFFDFYWTHLNQKPRRTRMQRLRYFPCGIELVEHTRQTPVTKPNPHKKTELFHRFAGITPSGELFYVQIKEEPKKRQKYLMSIFPPE